MFEISYIGPSTPSRTKADPGDLSLGELGITLDVLLARLGVSQDWELANSLLGLPATAAEVLPVKARKEAEFWQRADEGLKRLGERLGLPLPQQPYYPAGHGDEYS